jgi:hypothetical protein
MTQLTLLFSIFIYSVRIKKRTEKSGELANTRVAFERCQHFRNIDRTENDEAKYAPFRRTEAPGLLSQKLDWTGSGIHSRSQARLGKEVSSLMRRSSERPIGFPSISNRRGWIHGEAKNR